MSNSPCFPPELERYIFETAALFYPHTIPRLLPVARRVLIWIEPLLYRRVYFDGLSQKVWPRCSNLACRPEWLQTHRLLRDNDSLFMHSFLGIERLLQPPREEGVVRRHLQTVFRACSGVDNLFFLATSRNPSFLKWSQRTMRPRRIVLILDLAGFQPDLSLSLFDNITHLLLGDINLPNNILDENWDQLANLQNLPRLTHLALSDCSTSSIFVSMLLSGLHTLAVFRCLHARTNTLSRCDP
ncbi:hypothetical protein R3P38DRAFT_3234964 [Favolaschia claudopus]|uniref:Uncharacterized protein n=1 Tax=Favolaschia claudopus TaxID=2862362 RepID=A0AAV9ZD79_9AGAR